MSNSFKFRLLSIKVEERLKVFENSEMYVYAKPNTFIYIYI